MMRTISAPAAKWTKGKYAVFGSLYIENTDSSDGEVVTCHLTGVGSDESKIDLESGNNEQLTMGFQAVGELSAQGSAAISCSDDGTATDTTARSIRLTAIRDRKITAGVSP